MSKKVECCMDVLNICRTAVFVRTYEKENKTKFSTLAKTELLYLKNAGA